MMSTSPTAQDIDTMDINELRQLLKEQSARLQAQADQLLLLEKAKADADLSLLNNTTNSFSPLPATNLSNSLTVVAAMNEQRVSEICKSLMSEMEGNFATPTTKVFRTFGGSYGGFDQPPTDPHWFTRSIFASFFTFT